MKKRLLIITLLITLLFTSCSKPVEKEEVTPEPEPKIEDTACDFYKSMYSSKTRPIALMIDNDKVERYSKNCKTVSFASVDAYCKEIMKLYQ